MTETDPGSVIGYSLGALACVVIGAIMSGLQVGYFSLDPMKLQMLQLNPEADVKDQERAKQLIPLLDRHHLLLVTLLVANAAAMETLPILLDELVPSYVAIIMAVTLVLVAGEIIPQALCTSRPLLIGSFFAPFIKFLMVLTAPVSWPMAKLLDWIIGEESGNHFLLKKNELHALVDLHSSAQGGHLHHDEVSIMKGALAFGQKPVSEIMTPLDKCFMIELHRVLDYQLFFEIFDSGFSRIPVFDKNKPSHDNIVGLLIVKDMLLLDPKDEFTLEQLLEFYPHHLEKVFFDSPLTALLGAMKSGRSHMAIVHDINNKGPGDPFRVNLGIVTLEDILESIIGMEIEDETDINEAEMLDDTSSVLLTSSGGGRAIMLDRFKRRHFNQTLSPNEKVAIRHQLQQLVDVFGPNGKLSEQNLKALIDRGQVFDVRVKAQHRPSASAPVAPMQPPSPTEISTSVVPAITATPGSSLAISVASAHAVVDLSTVDVSAGGYSLYNRGEASEYFTLIIDGAAQVKAGVEGFVSEIGSWSVLGTQALRSAHATLKKKPAAHPLQQTVTVLPPFAPDFTATLITSARVLRISRKDYLSAVRREMGLEAEEIKEAREVKGTKRPSQPVKAETPTHAASLFSIPLTTTQRTQSAEPRLVDSEVAASIPPEDGEANEQDNLLGFARRKLSEERGLLGHSSSSDGLDRVIDRGSPKPHPLSMSGGRSAGPRNK